MHAVVLFEYPSLNGGEYSFLAKLPYLRQAGIRITAVGPSRGPLAAQLRLRDVPLVGWDRHDVTGRSLEQSDLRAQLMQIIQTLRPDLVHANSLSMSRLLGPVARRLGVPGLGHLRDIVRLSAQAIRDINELDRVLAVSHATRQWHVDQGLDSATVSVQWNGVNLRHCSPGRATGYLHAELGLPARSRLIGAIGQLGLRKGSDVFLHSARDIAEAVPDVHWIVVGERNSRKAEAIQFESDLHRMAASPGLMGRVHFLGRRCDIPELLRELQVLVHAARQEPLGRILLESGAAACAIVATRVGGTFEIFPPESKAAVLVEPDDTAAICREIRRLLADNRERSRLGAAARNRIIQDFDVEKRGPELAFHYRQLGGVEKSQHL